MRANTSQVANVATLFDMAKDIFVLAAGLANTAGTHGGPFTLADMGVSEIHRLLDIKVLGCML